MLENDTPARIRESLEANVVPILESTSLGYAVGTISLMVRDALTVARELPEGMYEPSKLRDLRAEQLVPRISRSVLGGAAFGVMAGVAHAGATALEVVRPELKDGRNFAVSGALVGATAGLAAYPSQHVRSLSMGAAFWAAIMFPYGVLQQQAQRIRQEERLAEEHRERLLAAAGASPSPGSEAAPPLKPWELPPGSQQTGWTISGLGEVGGLSLGAYAIIILYGVSRYLKFRKNRLGIERRK